MENLILKKWRFHSIQIDNILREMEQLSKFQFFKKMSLKNRLKWHSTHQRRYSSLLSEAGFW